MQLCNKCRLKDECNQETIEQIKCALDEVLYEIDDGMEFRDALCTERKNTREEYDTIRATIQTVAYELGRWFE